MKISNQVKQRRQFTWFFRTSAADIRRESKVDLDGDREAISVSSRNTCGIENDMGMKDGARDDLATGAAGFETGWHRAQRISERVVARSKPAIGGIVEVERTAILEQHLSLQRKLYSALSGPTVCAPPQVLCFQLKSPRSAACRPPCSLPAPQVPLFLADLRDLCVCCVHTYGELVRNHWKIFDHSVRSFC